MSGIQIIYMLKWANANKSGNDFDFSTAARFGGISFNVRKQLKPPKLQLSPSRDDRLDWAE